MSHCTQFSELDISHADGFGEFSMKHSVFSSSSFTWMWNTLLSFNLHASNSLIISPSAYWNPVYLPLLLGVREYINSATQSGMRIQFWFPSLLPWTFLCTLCKSQSTSFEDQHLMTSICQLEYPSENDTIVSICKASLLFTKYALHFFGELYDYCCWYE